MKLSKNAEQKTRATRPSKKYSPRVVQNISSPYIKKIGTPCIIYVAYILPNLPKPGLKKLQHSS